MEGKKKVKAGVMIVKGVSYLTASVTMWVAHKTVDKITGKKRERK